MKQDIGLLVLRLGAGLPMAFAHGLGKLTNWSHLSTQFADPIGLGPSVSLALVIFAEFFCAIAISIGLATRFLAFPLAFTMFIAFFQIHAADPFGKKEKAFLYLIFYIVLMFTGSGKFSIDYLINKKGFKK